MRQARARPGGFAVEFLGCKVSMTDAQEVREQLTAAGHAEVGPERAAVRIVNTCCVTAEAVAKSRKAIRRAARTAERVLVTGCGANLDGAAFEGVAANVTVVRGTPEATPRLVAGWVGELGCAGPQPSFPRTRAYVKVQDGCSFSCSYCVIPQVRGPSRSRRAADVLADVARRARQGHREVVLTGINLGCFRDRPAGMRLPDLVVAVAEVQGVERVRLSSIEVNHVSDVLLAAMAHPGVSRHLHVPMQSGDDGVLQAMRRRYTAARFLAAMRRARQLVPGINLTTDVIVGHPAEDDAAFARTLAAVREAGFTRVHVFPYSPRPGTADAGSNPVPAGVKAERSRRLRALADAQARAHRRGLRGTRQRVLVETEAGRGYTDDYTPLVVSGGQPGTIVEVVA
jgi:threonylcarbamoyladenosine tRNA methylthiotransferase MtaB